MSRENHALGIVFNDNSGAIGSFAHSQCTYDLERLYSKGKWRARFILLKYSIQAIRRAEFFFKLTNKHKETKEG